MKLTTISIALLALIAVPAGAQTLEKGNEKAILKAMTDEEKCTLVVGMSMSSAYWGLPSASDRPDARELVPGAAGQTFCIPRLGIPCTVVADGPAGLRISPTREGDPDTYYCTGFPVGISLASSWNTALVENTTKAMGEEVKEYGVDVLLAPGMNIQRNPLCGRNFEYFSEDPVLSGKIAAAYVRGIQSNGVGVSIKHYAGNNQETNRDDNDIIVSERALREIYLKNFEIAVKEGKPWTVMSSYNRINGPYTQEDKWLLTDVLRKDWGYEGIVMTDWTRLRNTVAQIKAGNDLMMPGVAAQIEELQAALKNGSLKRKDLDACVLRILQYITRTPRFAGYEYSNKPDLKAHAEVTRQAAAEGMVLLKNEAGMLPMAADAKVALFGNTSYDFIGGGKGSGDVNKAYVVDLMQGLKNVGVQLDDELSELYAKSIEYQKSLYVAEYGKDFIARAGWYATPRLRETIFPAGVYDKYAQANDLAIITLGRQSGEGSDRMVDKEFNLCEEERDMITEVCRAFHAKGKKVVVVLDIAGSMETASWKNLPDAILLSWLPGQEGGNSIADVLTGRNYPSGKLPVTFVNDYWDCPSAQDFPTNVYFTQMWDKTKEQKEAIPNVRRTVYNDGIYVGYRYYDTKGVAVSYPFGYGLSYTEFEYSGLKVRKAGKAYNVTLKVTNTGKAAGKEVVELYVSAPGLTMDKPEKELKAFAKTGELAPGQSETITMTVKEADLASWNETKGAWEVEKGTYTFKVGASSRDIRLTAQM